MKRYLLFLLMLTTTLVVLYSCNRKQKGKELADKKEITIDIAKMIEDLNNYECVGCDYCDDCENPDSISFLLDVDRLLEYFRESSCKLASNVEFFLDSIGEYTGIPVHMPDEPEDELGLVRCAVHELRRYQTGERQYYPEKEIKEALDCMAFELGYIYSHGGDYWYISLYYWFNFATQAALLSPNLEFISHTHSPDHQIGLLSYHEWSYWPLMSFIIKQEDNYCTIQLIDLEINLKKVFQIKSEKGQEYFLLVSQYDNPDVRSKMDVYLFERTRDKDVKLVTQFHDDSFLWNMFNYHEITDDFKITFNPQKNEWDICKKKGEYWHKIEGTKSLYLHLDEKEPYFEIH